MHNFKVHNFKVGDLVQVRAGTFGMFDYLNGQVGMIMEVRGYGYATMMFNYPHIAAADNYWYMDDSWIQNFGDETE